MNRMVFDDKERVGAWVASRVDQKASWGSFYAMGCERNGELVAGAVINNYNGSNATGHLAIDKPGKDMLALFHHVCDYAFRHCKLNRLTIMVPSNLPDVIAFDQRIGFEPEFVMKKAGPDGSDLHVMVMWPDRCPWLAKRSE